jgi:hypothetical protein
MAITIQDLLASDTISQAVDKINFNFDQLLLNGGGPVGPPGPVGPSGPIGGRGERGTEWYEGVDSPNVTPPTITPLIADYYLQSNGDVWEYTGLTWTNTGINLKGPAGPAGVSGGWSAFGNGPIDTYVATASNVAYPSLIDINASESTATSENQGVKVAAFGIAGPNDSNAFLDSKFQISADMAGSLDASVLSILAHQGNSNSKGIVFMGGGAIPSENYEQDNFVNLSYINLGADDTININVPKPTTTTVGTTATDLIGFNVFTELRGQNFRAGNNFTVATGTKSDIDTASDNSNIEFTVNKIPNSSTGTPSFSVNTLNEPSVAGGGQTSMILGPGSAPNTTNANFDGGIQFKSKVLNIATNLTTDILSDGTASIRVPSSTGGSNQLSINTTGINMTAANNPINISSGIGAISISNTLAPISVDSYESINLVATNLISTFPTASVELSQSLLRMAGYGEGDGITNDWENNNVIISSQTETHNVMIGIGLIPAVQDNTTGKIILGKKQNIANRAFYSNIRLDYQTNASATGIIQLSGNYQYTPGGEPTPLSSLKDVSTSAGEYYQKAFQATSTVINQLGMSAGDVMFRNGVYSDNSNGAMQPGIAQEGWMDSFNGAIWIGKTLNKTTTGGDSANIGLFVNKAENSPESIGYKARTYWQGETIDPSEFYPPTEVFGATTQGIHLSTKVLWGGNNNAAGVKYINIDMFQKLAGYRGPTPPGGYTLAGNHNYYKIVAGPTGYGQPIQGGSGMNYNNPIASATNFYGASTIPGGDPPTCNITLANPGEGAKGQMVIVEIILASGYLKTDNGGTITEFFLRPNINFTWEEANSSGTTPVQDKEGKAIDGTTTNLTVQNIPELSNGYRPQYIRWVGQFIYNGESLPFLGSGLGSNAVTDFNGTPRWTLIGATQSTTTNLTQEGYGA